MVEVTMRIREVLAAYKSILTFQPWYFFSTLSTTSWNVPSFDFPINISNLKYFPFDPSIFKPMLLARTDIGLGQVGFTATRNPTQ